MPVIQCYCRNVMPQKMCSDKPEGFKLLNYVSNSSTIQPFCQVCHTLSHSVTQPLRVPVLVDPTLFFPSPTPPPKVVCTSESILCVQLGQKSVCTTESVLCAQVSRLPLASAKPAKFNNICQTICTELKGTNASSQLLEQSRALRQDRDM